jgi:hypothetical protein
MRYGPAKRRFRRSLSIDVDKLMVLGAIGKRY